VPFYKLSDVIHASVACGVDFNHIQGGTISDRFADLTHAARLFRRFIPLQAIEGLARIRALEVLPVPLGPVNK